MEIRFIILNNNKVMLEKNLILTVYNEMTAAEISKQAKEEILNNFKGYKKIN